MHKPLTWVYVIPETEIEDRKVTALRHYHKQAHSAHDGDLLLHLTHDETEEGFPLFSKIHTIQTTTMKKAQRAMHVPHASVHEISEDYKQVTINVVTGTRDHVYSHLPAPKDTEVYVTIVGENAYPPPLQSLM